jgi:phosphocarrier protein
MVSTNIKLTNPTGLHMRPADIFTKAMSKYQSNITITFKDKEINGKSIINLMTACIKKDCEIGIDCEGPDEREMLAEAVALIESGFGE